MPLGRGEERSQNKFYINPTMSEAAAAKILNLVVECDRNPKYWQEISLGTIE